MKIPIKNLFWILCYAWDILQTGKSIESSVDGEKDTINLMARIFIEVFEQIRKYGFEKAYISETDDGRTIRGKINFGESLKKMLFQQGKVACDYDEFSLNIVPNKIIKTITSFLLSNEELDERNESALLKIQALLGDVSLLSIEQVQFRRLPISYRNRSYPLMMQLCEIIWESILPSEQAGKYIFQDFVRDERQMRKVFEHFIRNFYKIEQSYFSVKSERFAWQAQALTNQSGIFLPQMQTDTSLISEQRKIVIETKFVDGPIKSGQMDKETFRSAHLYQLMAYLKNLAEKDGLNPEGILLYPAVGESHIHRFKMLNHDVTVATVDLTKSWNEISKELLALVAA